jgi:ribonuclease P protein component
MVRSAVDRNRMKRALREIFRRHRIKAAGLDVVVMFKAPFTPAEERSVVGEVKELFDKACEIRA